MEQKAACPLVPCDMRRASGQTLSDTGKLNMPPRLRLPAERVLVLHRPRLPSALCCRLLRCRRHSAVLRTPPLCPATHGRCMWWSLPLASHGRPTTGRSGRWTIPGSRCTMRAAPDAAASVHGLSSLVSCACAQQGVQVVPCVCRQDGTCV